MQTKSEDVELPVIAETTPKTPYKLIALAHCQTHTRKKLHHYGFAAGFSLHQNVNPSVRIVKA